MNDSQSITILLVDDEPALLKLSGIMLRRLGYETITASTAEEAIEIARTHVGEIDLLITDVMLPEMNGHDLAEQIVSDHPGMRRLYISGYSANIVTAAEASAPGIDFLPKPFTRDQLADKLTALLAD